MQKNYHTDNKSFMVYKEWEEYLKMLTDEEAGRMFRALFAFAARGEEADFEGAAAMLFAVMKNCLERDGKKWEDTCAAHSRKKTKLADETDETNETNETSAANAYDKDKEKDKDIDKDKDKEKEPPKGRRSACGGKSRSAEKKIINSGHSYDLDKLVEYAMTHVPTFPPKRGGG